MGIKQKILLPILVLCALFLVMTGATWLVSQGQKQDALVVNLAGRQRMLTQKMAKETLLARVAAKESEQAAKAAALGKVEASIKVFEATLAALAKSGSAPISLDPAGPARAMPAPSPEVAAQLGQVETLWKEYRGLLDAWRKDGETGLDPAAFLAKSEEVNKAMDKAVSMMQAESEQRVSLLLTLQGGITALALVLALGIAWLLGKTVFAPLDRVIGYAREVSAGGLQASPPSAMTGELETLRSTLAHMLQEIKTKFGFSEGVLTAISDTFPYLVLDTGGRITHVNAMMLKLIERPGTPADCTGLTPGAFFYTIPAATPAPHALRAPIRPSTTKCATRLPPGRKNPSWSAPTPSTGWTASPWACSVSTMT